MNLLSTAGRRLAVGAAAVCAAIVVPAAALAAPGGQATPAHRAADAAVKPCVNAHPALRGGAFVWSANPGDGYAGGVSYELEITNVGTRACSLRGTPAMAAVLSNGHLAGGKPVPGSAKGRLIVLAPRATAHVGLTVVDAGAICSHPVNANIVLYLPGQGRSQSTSMSAQVCSSLRGGGVLRPSAIAAGTGIPLYDI
jgi:hypothetical protein